MNEKINIIYARVSSEEQNKVGVSIEAQIESIQEFIRWKGLEGDVLIITDGGVSGSVPFYKRPGGKQVEKMISEGKVSRILATKLDRLFRGLVDCISKLDDWKDVLDLYLNDEGGTLESSTPGGWLAVATRAMISEYEIRQGAQRTKTALDFNKKRGRAWNHAPYGYDKIGIKGESRLIRNEREQNTIFNIRELYIGGSGYSNIARKLNDNNIYSKKGGRWSAQTVKQVLLRNKEEAE